MLPMPAEYSMVEQYPLHFTKVKEAFEIAWVTEQFTR